MNGYSFFIFSFFPFLFLRDYQQLLLCRGFYWRVPQQQQQHHTFFCCCCRRHLLSSFVVQLTDQTQSIIKQQYHHLCSNLRFPSVFWNLIQALSLSLSNFFIVIDLACLSSGISSFRYFILFFLVVLAQIWGQNFEIFLFLFVLSNQRFSRLTELDDSSFHELVHERAKIWPISTSQRLLV